MEFIDVTSEIKYGMNDDETMAIVCKCGFGGDNHGMADWSFSISIYKDDPDECPQCGRKYYWEPTFKIFMDGQIKK